jgi:hypothetical protein
MRWLKRSVLLCLFITVVTPAPAHAWFEWLDRLSGPGPWYGLKVDIRAVCFGKQLPIEAVRRRIEDAADRTSRATNRIQLEAVQNEWEAIAAQLVTMDQGLNVLKNKNLGSTVNAFSRTLRTKDAVTAEDIRPSAEEVARAFNEIDSVLLAMASGGIFFSLCPEGKQRSFAVEIGLTGMAARRNPEFANNERSYMTTVTGGLSYRIPLPPTRDFIDLGANAGVYHFYLKDLRDVSGFTLEPYVDLHLPTQFAASDSAAERFFSRFTLRAGLQFFPSGFEAGAFGPSTRPISGNEATKTLTIYYNVRKAKPIAASPRKGA